MTTILPNIHTSPETAYVIEDYPYGFRLRCKRRVWLETNKKGTRYCTQTTNPKKAGEVWNKPKYSTYADSGAMYLDENDHVRWEGLHFGYSDESKIGEYLGKFGENCSNYAEAKRFLRMKEIFREIFREQLDKFTPRPEYGSAAYRLAYLGAITQSRAENAAAA